MSQQTPTYVARVKNDSKIALERPTCLNFRTKTNMKRNEIIKLLKSINYAIENVMGIAEMKNKSIDITCKTRANVLELYERLKEIDEILNLRLYESNKVNVLIGWVPIPMKNERLKQVVEEVFAKAINIIKKNIKMNKPLEIFLLSGIRIITMNKTDLESNPIPSYIYVDNFELYVTYEEQPITCKCCGEVGHVQANCKTRAADFPQLITNQANTQKTKVQAIQATTTFELRSPSLTNQQINFSQQPLNLTKKRKIDSDISGSDNNTKVTIGTPCTNNSSEDLIENTSSDKIEISNANETSNNDINWWDMACPITVGNVNPKT